MDRVDAINPDVGRTRSDNPNGVCSVSIQPGDNRIHHIHEGNVKPALMEELRDEPSSDVARAKLDR